MCKFIGQVVLALVGGVAILFILNIGDFFVDKPVQAINVGSIPEEKDSSSYYNLDGTGKAKPVPPVQVVEELPAPTPATPSRYPIAIFTNNNGIIVLSNDHILFGISTKDLTARNTWQVIPQIPQE